MFQAPVEVVEAEEAVEEEEAGTETGVLAADDEVGAVEAGGAVEVAEVSEGEEAGTASGVLAVDDEVEALLEAEDEIEEGFDVAGAPGC